MTSSPETTGASRPRIERTAAARRLSALGAFLLVGWLCFPGSYEAPGSGLDPSWIVGLNLFAHQGFRFGQDVIFTYGPLGYLARPLDIGDHLLLGNWTRAIVFCATLGTAALLLRRPARRSSVWLFLALFPLTLVAARDLDYEVVGLIVLLCSIAVVEGWGWLFLPAAVLAALVPWIKFGTGVCAVATLGLALVCWRVLGGRWREVVLAAGAYLLTFGLLARALVGSMKGLTEFLHTSSEIAGGYNAAMVTIGDSPSVIVAIVMLIVLGGLSVWVIKTRPRQIALMVIGSVSVIYAWKHSMVRQDPGHSVIFFTVVFWCVLTWLLLAEDGRSRRAWAVCLLIPLLYVGVALSARQFERRSEELADFVKRGRGPRNLHALLHPAQARRELQERTPENLGLDALPAEWLKILGQEPVLVVPWEISLCLANALRCMPYPTLQMYSTYTPMLDRWTSRRIHEVSPRFVIASVAAIDERNMVWDCPETWETLLRGWEVIRKDSATGYLLLARRETPSPWQERELARVEGKVGAWIPLPPRTGPVRARLHFRERWWRTVERTLFRAPPVTVELMTETGRRQVFNLVLETAADGLLIDAAPETPEELAALFSCCAVRERARQIRVFGPGARALQPEFTVVWSEVTTPDGLTTLPPSPIAEVPIVSGLPFLAIDRFDLRQFEGARQPIHIDPSMEELIISGWAADREARRPASGVFLRLDGGRLEVPAIYGTARDDVARYFKEPGFSRIGYRGVVSLHDLERGQHTIQLRVVSSDGRWSQLSAPIELDVR